MFELTLREQELERTRDALAAANERIRELENALAIQVDDSRKWYERHAAEREVSDKLEKALRSAVAFNARRTFAGFLVAADEQLPFVAKSMEALAKVAALRATHTNGEQA